MRLAPSSRWLFPATGILVATLGVAAAAHFDSAQGRSARPVAQPPPTATRANPDTDPRAATARKLCGVCHPFETIVSIRRTRSQWEATVENMISRGARGTSAEFASVVAFLAESYGLNAPPNRGGAGPDDKPLVDSKAAEMGRPVYGENCVTCHGGDARGTATGSNLVRSLVVLHDRYGSTLGPYLRASHPPVPIGGKGSQIGPKFEALTNTQVLVLAHFLRERVNDTLRGAPMFKPGNVLTGDPRAGAEYFNGEGGCAKCHSPTGDLAGIGKRLEPVNLQQRFLFPANAARQSAAGKAKTVTVTVTSESGETLSGELDRMDDFNVSLRDASGAYRSVRRTAATRVVKNDPFAAHVDLLARITDKNIHDVVAYLETLK